MSSEANRILAFILREISEFKYTFRPTIEGCYDASIKNYGYNEPPEDKDVIVDKAIELLNDMVNNEI